ncbi:MAG: chemotaxis protein CheW [bacterium]
MSADFSEIENNLSLDTTSGLGQYVTFVLGEEEYGIEILRVQEIIRYQEFTKLPNLPDFIKGVINLRGTVVPVIDLRLKFHLEEKDSSQSTVIIVLEVSGRIMGVVVDSIHDVISLSDEEFQATPALSSKIRTDFIKGMGKKKDKMIIMLDINKVLSEEELEMVDEVN